MVVEVTVVVMDLMIMIPIIIDDENSNDSGSSSDITKDNRIKCPITYERIIAMCTKPNDYLIPCTICGPVT